MLTIAFGFNDPELSLEGWEELRHIEREAFGVHSNIRVSIYTVHLPVNNHQPQP